MPYGLVCNYVLKELAQEDEKKELVPFFCFANVSIHKASKIVPCHCHFVFKLQSLLENTEVKLDSVFRTSLIADLIKVSRKNASQYLLPDVLVVLIPSQTYGTPVN